MDLLVLYTPFTHSQGKKKGELSKEINIPISFFIHFVNQ